MTEQAMELPGDLLAEGHVEAPIVLRRTRELGVRTKAIRTANDRLSILWKRQGLGPGAKTYRSLLGMPCVPSDHIDAARGDEASMAEKGVDGDGGEDCGQDEG